MKQFPIIRAKGSHYEVGRAVGVVRRDAIVKLFTKNTSSFPDYFVRHRQESTELLRNTREYFPQYIDELRGLADGAGLDVEELFLSNAHEVSYFAEPTEANHCTIIGIANGDGYVVGHNEDWEIDANEHLYILDAEVDGVRIFGLGYDFTNTIIGDSIAINQFGLIQAINDVSHQDTQIGAPKGFVARAILDCKTLEEAENIMRAVPRAAGFNHVLVQGKRLWNIESSAKEYVIEKVEMQKYVHTNHYLTDLKRIDKGNAESKNRYRKVQKHLAGVNSVEDVKRMLSDRNDPPVCRDSTIGSVVLDMLNKVAHIAYGQPTPDAYVEYSLKDVVA